MAPIRVGFVLHVMDVAGAETLVNETIRRLGSRIDPVVFCLDRVGVIGERLLADGIPVIAYGRRPGLDISVSRRMARDIRARHVQILHAHQYTPFFYAAIAAQMVRPRPRVIFTEHGRHYPDVVSARRRWLNRLVFDHLADDVNAVCQFSATSLATRDGFRGERVHVIANGVDLPKYATTSDVAGLRSRLGLNPTRKYIACVARFHPVKDHRTLIAAFGRVAGHRSDVDLLLVGDGPLRADLAGQCRELNLEGRIHFLGIRDDVADLLQAADVFALTSVSEAASITLLEAMATGLPVVVTDVGGNPEIVRNGVDGLLAPRGNAEAIAMALARILDDPALGRGLGASAAARVKSTFLLDQTVDKYYELYAFHAGIRRAA